ncbi:MAG TPA: hypothetical protein VJ577_08560 [Burkholderiaceae bacterium]|nr:hypothetical protein [Burkholderiaceae bacterium]
MKFLLNLVYCLGTQKEPARINAEEPIIGDLAIGPWPPRGIKRQTRFRRIAFFYPDELPDRPLHLYEPVFVRCTSTFMEISGIESDGDVDYLQSWALRLAIPMTDGALGAKYDDQDYFIERGRGIYA